MRNQDLERELGELRNQADRLQRSAAADRWAQEAMGRVAEQLRELFQQRDREATFWQFMFFAQFFSPLTNAILRSLAGHGAPVTKSYLHAIWAPSVPYLENRNASLKALTETGVVRDLRNAYAVSDVGQKSSRMATD